MTKGEEEGKWEEEEGVAEWEKRMSVAGSYWMKLWCDDKKEREKRKKGKDQDEWHKLSVKLMITSQKAGRKKNKLIEIREQTHRFKLKERIGTWHYKYETDSHREMKRRANIMF